MKKIRSRWDRIYRKKKLSYVSKLSSWDDIIKFLKNRSARTVLDIGCGGGKHLVGLAKRDFSVTGIDNSPEAIRIARALFEKEGLRSNLKIANMHKKIPFKNNSFDAIISLRTLNHGKIKEIKKSFSEIKRILKTAGIVFITVQKVSGFRNRQGKRKLNNLKVNFVEPRTYVKLESNEKGVVHFTFNKDILIKLLKGFKILRFWVDYGKEDWEKYYCVLAEKVD